MEREPRAQAASAHWIASCSAPASERTEAVDRALRLLVSHLSDEQLASLTNEHVFRVRGSKGGNYQIGQGYVYNITRLDSKGKAVAKYCIQFRETPMPIADHVLAQKLMIEADEERFLAIANCEPLESAQTHVRYVSADISWSDLRRMHRPGVSLRRLAAIAVMLTESVAAALLATALVRGLWATIWLPLVAISALGCAASWKWKTER